MISSAARRRKRRTSLAFFVAAALLALLACRKKPNVSLEVDLPQAIDQQTKWLEIGVFAGTSCAGLAPLLPGGLPAEGAVARLAFDRTKDSPTLGDLAKAKYAFAAVARDDKCAVIGYGCADVDVSSENNVVIAVKAADQGGAGPCPPGSACVAARCVPGNDNGDPAIGADCSLQLVGSGPLSDPLVQNGGIVSPPAIVATPKGFLIGYREYSTFDGQSRMTFITIDNGGGATPGPVTVLPDRCQSGPESDGLGLAFQNDTQGDAIVSRAPCTPKLGGIDFLVLDPTGAVSSSGFEGNTELRHQLLSPSHPLAWDQKLQDYLLVFTQNGDAQLVFPNGNHLETRSPISFGGTGTKTGAWVASTDRVRAFVAVGTGGTTPIDDGGGGGGDDASDDGGEAGPPPPPPPPADSGNSSSVRVQVLQASEDIALLGVRPVDGTFPGSWASVAAFGARVVVASDGPTAGKQVTFRVYDGSTEVTSDGLIVEGQGTVAYTDIAMISDRLFFAVEKSSPPSAGAITLYAYTSATTTPAFKRRVILPEDPRIPAMGNVHDGLISIAASDTRVALVWATGKTLTEKDAVGGYAVFACSGQ